MERVISFFGIFVILGIAYALSNNRKQISKRVVLWGMGLQLLFGILILGVPALGIPGVLRFLFNFANSAFMQILAFTDEGSNFIFGHLNNPAKAGGFIFAIKVLPTIIFFSSLMAIGYHLKIMQKIVKGMAFLMQKTMKVSGAESLSTAANIFVGQTEAPLMVRPYLDKMTKSELMAVMTGGMATVAGGVMAAYVGFLHERLPEIAGHLLTASVMSAPAALVLAKILLPETEQPETQEVAQISEDSGPKDANVIEAAARGAGEGLTLAFNVGAMLLAFIALIAMVNYGLGYLGKLIAFEVWGQSLVPSAFLVEGKIVLSLQLIFGWLFAPLAWVMGIPASECAVIGSLLGEKIALNEFVAYLHLSNLSDQLSDRSMIIASYALCGFANLSSIAIQIGGIGGIAPNRRSDLAKLGIRAMIAGTLAACLTGTLAGFLI